MRCLNLKITYKCSNQCSFCFSQRMETSGEVHNLLDALVDGQQRGCRHLVLSGGEPTLEPEIIILLVNHAIKLGYSHCTIQTNGVGLQPSSSLLAELRKRMQGITIKFSISLHGSTARIHDSLTRTPGSYALTCNAISAVSEFGFKFFTNTVLNKSNINDLKEMLLLFQAISPEIFQFSVMHTDYNNKLALSLAESVEAIHGILPFVDKQKFRTEGIPYCLMRNYEECVGESYWPKILDIFNEPGRVELNFKQLDDGMRWRPHHCETCLLAQVCHGVWREFRGEFETLSSKPIVYD